MMMILKSLVTNLKDLNEFMKNILTKLCQIKIKFKSIFLNKVSQPNKTQKVNMKSTLSPTFLRTAMSSFFI